MANPQRFVHIDTGEVSELTPEGFKVVGMARDFSPSPPTPAQPAAPIGGDVGQFMAAKSAENQAAEQKQREGFSKLAAAVATPAALTLAGTLAGPAIAGGLGVTGAAGVAGVTTAAEALGGLAGEGINQLTGLAKPSPAALYGTAVAPMTGRLVGEGVRRIIPYLPGAQAGRSELAVKTAENLPDRIRAAMTGDPEALYAVANNANAHSYIADLLPKTREKVLELLAGPRGEFRLSPYAQSTPIREQSRVFLRRQAGEAAGPHAGEVAVAPLQEEYSRLGERATSQSLMGRVKGRLRQLYRAITEDLEAAASDNPGIAALLDANRNYRLEMTASELGDMIQSKIASKEGGLTIRANADAIINALERPRSPSQRSLVEELQKLGHYDDVLAGIRKAGEQGGKLSVGQQGEFFRRHVGLALLGAIPAYITGVGVPAAAVYGTGLATEHLLGTSVGKKLVQSAMTRPPLSGRVLPNVAQFGGQTARAGLVPAGPEPTPEPVALGEPGALKLGEDGWLE